MDMNQVNEYEACMDLYNNLTDLKHFIFSTTQIAKPLEMAMILAGEIHKKSSPERSAIWLAEKSGFTELSVDGKEIPPVERRFFAANSFMLFSQISGEHRVLWNVEPSEKEVLFPRFRSPVIFSLKWHMTVLGFIAIDNVTQFQADMFQFYVQYGSMLLNMARLYSEVKEQQEELNELAGILFEHNSQLAALHKVGIEVATTDDPERICQIIATTAVNELSARRAAVLLADEKSHELQVFSAIGLEGIGNIRMDDPTDSRVIQAIETGRIVSYKDTCDELHLGAVSMNDWVIFPFKGRTRNLGVLIAQIGEEDVSDSMAILVNHGAIILDTVKMMEEKIRMNESLTIRTNELVLANKQLEQLSVTDHLTGLFNRRHFQERLPIELSRASRYRRPLSLLMIDIDHFKNINDTFGHAAGDEVLKEVSRRLVATVRLSDLVVRYGGEEIVILLTDASMEVAKAKAERLRLAVCGNNIDAGEASIPASVSIGVAVFPSPLVTKGENLCDEADKAMYRAKNAGRNRVEVAE